MNRRDRRRAESAQRAQERRLQKDVERLSSLLDDVKRGAAKTVIETGYAADWEKAALAISELMAAAAREGVRVFLRPTTTPSPHGRDAPIEIGRSEDGRGIFITLFDVPEDIRQDFIAKAARSNAFQIIREERGTDQ